jgi:hypothetical protein
MYTAWEREVWHSKAGAGYGASAGTLDSLAVILGLLVALYGCGQM